MTETNESFGHEGSGSIMVTPGYEFRPFHSAYQYVPSDQEQTLDAQIQRGRKELRRKLDKLAPDNTDLDPETFISRDHQSSDREFPQDFHISQLALHDFGGLPNFRLRIQATELESRITGITPFASPQKYMIDDEDYDRTKRIAKLEHAIGNPSAESPILIQAFANVDDLVAAGIGTKIKGEKYFDPIKFTYDPKYRVKMGGLRMKIRLGTDIYEAWPQESGFDNGYVCFRYFYPENRGPMPLVFDEYGRLIHDRGLPMTLPKDPKKLKELYTSFHIDDEWVADWEQELSLRS